MRTEGRAPFAKDLVLAGGGHSHALLLAMMKMEPLSGVRVTLVSDVSHAPYSGMVPGLIAGHYSFDDAHIDLRRLCEATGADYVSAKISGVDATAKCLILDGQPALLYDLLSLNTGAVPDADGVPGLFTHAVPVKPVPRLLRAWGELSSGAASDPSRPRGVVIVGAGAGGIELALAIKAKLPSGSSVTLIEKGASILPLGPKGARDRLKRALSRRGIGVRTGSVILGVDDRCVRLQGGDQVPYTDIFLATSAKPALDLTHSGLALDERGFVAVQATLRSTSHAEVFAAGDGAAIVGAQLPKSGVFAVRQARPLFDNVRRALDDKQLYVYKPQRDVLALVGLGEKRAVAFRSSFAAEGAWAWRLKEWIDRRFMDRFAKVGAQEAAATTEGENRAAMRCHGCAAKVAPDILTGALQGGAEKKAAGVPIGLSARDDAAAIEVPSGKWLVQSVDQLTALVSDRYTFGRIAAAHAFSDVYAMNGTPHSALAVVNVPFAKPRAMQAEIARLMRGIEAALSEMGAVLLGGHTAEGKETAVALSVNGLVDPSAVWQKGGLEVGDALVLTKPLGIGTLFAAAMRLKAKGRWLDEAVESMVKTNAASAKVLAQFGVRSATDVTGFGLAGHLGEMLQASRVEAEVALDRLPLLQGATETASQGILSTIDPGNRRAEQLIIARGAPLASPVYALLFDPQTSGGLLAGVRGDAADQCIAALRTAGVAHASVIGRVTRKGDPCLSVT